MSDTGHDNSHAPGPSLWPIGFAIGIALLLLGLVISWLVAAVGAIVAVVFGILWARDVTREVRGEVPEVEPETRAVAEEAAPAPAAAAAPAAEEPLPTYTRSRFLEATTLGLGVAIGAIVTVPVLGFTVLPPFTNLEEVDIDLGPIDNYPLDTFVIASFFTNPKAGEVGRRTAFIRNNGFSDSGEPSFTILYGRCVHLGCPVQPNGPKDEEQRKEVEGGIELTPVLAQSFGCPCHGALYDAEGNRQAGPPVRSMDRFEFSIKDRRLVLGQLFAVADVSGRGANATISRYPWSTPGTHVDGVEAWLYPVVPSQVTPTSQVSG